MFVTFEAQLPPFEIFRWCNRGVIASHQYLHIIEESRIRFTFTKSWSCFLKTIIYFFPGILKMYSYDYHSIDSGKVQLHFGLLGCDGVFSLHQLKISRMDTAYQQHEAGIFHISSTTQKRPTFFSWKTNGRAPEGFLCVKPSRFVVFPGLVARSQFRATL